MEIKIIKSKLEKKSVKNEREIKCEDYKYLYEACMQRDVIVRDVCN